MEWNKIIWKFICVNVVGFMWLVITPVLLGYALYYGLLRDDWSQMKIFMNEYPEALRETFEFLWE